MMLAQGETVNFNEVNYLGYLMHIIECFDNRLLFVKYVGVR